MTRGPQGSKIEGDWAKAQDSLLPVWGSLIGTHGSAIWLLVEGQDDQKAYVKISAICEREGRKCLPKELRIVPGGGDQLPVVAERFLSYGGFVIALLDGDQAGRGIVTRLKKLKSQKLKVVTVDSVLKDAKLEGLFAAGEFERVMSPGDKLPVLQKVTVDRFENVFALVASEFASLVTDATIGTQ